MPPNAPVTHFAGMFRKWPHSNNTIVAMAASLQRKRAMFFRHIHATGACTMSIAMGSVFSTHVRRVSPAISERSSIINSASAPTAANANTTTPFTTHARSTYLKRESSVSSSSSISSGTSKPNHQTITHKMTASSTKTTAWMASVTLIAIAKNIG